MLLDVLEDRLASHPDDAQAADLNQKARDLLALSSKLSETGS
jgi:hypothetical protein